MKEYVKIGENLYTDHKHRYTTKICEFCGKEFYCRNDKIERKKTCDPECYQKLIEKNNTYIINDNDLSIITGSLLSDGCITKGYNAKNYHYTHFSVHEEYANYLISNTNLNLSKHLCKRRHVGKYISNGGYNINSKYSVTFTEMKKLWYPNGKKIVPDNIEINPIVLLHWYIGDGTISNENGIILCTDAFDDKSMDILLEKLYKLDFLPHRNSYNRINIPNRRVFEFLKYIGKCPIKCFEYKWRSLIVESYNNRKCINCGKLFNTEYNHQIYCSEKCSILYSNKYGNKLKQMKKFI